MLLKDWGVICKLRSTKSITPFALRLNLVENIVLFNPFYFGSLDWVEGRFKVCALSCASWLCHLFYEEVHIPFHSSNNQINRRPIFLVFMSRIYKIMPIIWHIVLNLLLDCSPLFWVLVWGILPLSPSCVNCS